MILNPMIKRTTAFVFLVLASILVLTHAVVPHHHHGNQICFVNNHCINDNLKNEHGTNGKNHTHDGDGSSPDCILKEPALLSSYQWKTDLRSFNQTSGSSDMDGFLFTIPDNTTEPHFTFQASFISERSSDCLYTSLVSNSLGLRAPPVV